MVGKDGKKGILHHICLFNEMSGQIFNKIEYLANNSAQDSRTKLQIVPFGIGQPVGTAQDSETIKGIVKNNSVPTDNCWGRNLVGAHVQKAYSSDQRWYIVPLCVSCNNRTDTFNVNATLEPVPSNL